MSDVRVAGSVVTVNPAALVVVTLIAEVAVVSVTRAVLGPAVSTKVDVLETISEFADSLDLTYVVPGVLLDNVSPDETPTVTVLVVCGATDVVVTPEAPAVVEGTTIKVVVLCCSGIVVLDTKEVSNYASNHSVADSTVVERHFLKEELDYSQSQGRGHSHGRSGITHPV